MKFFVSSRMRELSIERKAAIEAIHFSGHTPLYIETEPFVKDREARDKMLSLISDADGLVSLHYLSEGKLDSDLLNGYTPIEFELLEFRKLQGGKPALLFRRTTDAYVQASKHMIDWFDAQASELNSPVIRFESAEQLQRKIGRALRPYAASGDDLDVAERVTVRYVGPDFIGLIGAISEILFSGHKLNIDDISHTSAGTHAALFLTCSPRRHLTATPSPVDVSQLREELLLAIEREYISTVPGTSAPLLGPQVFVDVDPVASRHRQFYLQIRAIDAPGQINAICKALRSLRYNIDDLQLKPTPGEYPRQRIMTLSISHWGRSGGSLRQEIDAIEGKLQYLVGVRAFAIRALEGARRRRGSEVAITRATENPAIDDGG